MRDFFRLFKMSDRARSFVALTILRVPFDTVRTLLIAFFTQRAFDGILAGNAGALYRACLFYGIGNLLLFLYNGTVWILYSIWYTGWIAGIRRRMFGHLSGLSLRQIEAKHSGEWITNLNADVRSATMILGHPAHLHHAGAMLLSILVSSAMLLRISPALYALILAFTIPQVLFAQIIARPMTDLAARAKEATAENAADLSALITCADTMILYDAQDLLLSRFERSSRQIRTANMRMRSRNALLQGILPLLGLGGYLLLLIVGGAWIAQGHLTFGGLTAVFQYRGGVMACAMILTTCIVNIRITLASIRRVMETMDIPREE